MFSIIYYRPPGLSEDKDSQVEEFLSDLMRNNMKLYVKTLRSLQLLMEHGSQLRMPYSEYLRDDIFELRTIMGNNITRLFYFFDKDKIIVLTHGIIKKSKKIPNNEIEHAIKAKEEYFRIREEEDFKDEE